MKGSRLPELIVFEPKVYRDSRGYFTETWNKKNYLNQGLSAEFVQDNVSFSTRGVLRGLHFQNPNPQGKLVHVLSGEIFDVAVDIRLGSPTFKQWFGIILSGENRRQIYIPEGFAHGFCVLSDTALVQYKCTEFYHPQCERSLLWNDPEIGIDWPNIEPVLSEKDRVALSLKDMPKEFVPHYG